jgi:hypothetical protein
VLPPRSRYALGQVAFLRGLQHVLGLLDGAQQRHRRAHLRGHVGGVLDDLERLAVHVQDRVVGGLDPDFVVALADALVLAGLVLAVIEVGPERPVFGAFAHLARHEDRVVFAGDLLQPVSHRIQEIPVGRDDGSVHVELDHGLRFADGVHLGKRVARLRIAAPQRHGEETFLRNRNVIG